MADKALPSAIVIGAGLGGLGAGIELMRAGVTDLTILERADDVGGVWRDNTYPGAACDVPSSLYSWSFAPNPSWSRRYAEQPDILDYIRREATRTGVLDHVRTGSEVCEATWDPLNGEWVVTLSTGEVLKSDVLVSAVGQLSRPAVPEIPGAEDFAGAAFHSAQWDHELALAGRRVAVIGTGASAIQLVPAIADEVASLTVFQRSAPYVLPKPDRAYNRLHHAVFARLPGAQRLGRRTTFRLTEMLNRALTRGSWLTRAVSLAWRLHLRATIRDADLRRRLRPDHPLGCKRILFSNDWYPALAREHVEVVTEGIAGLAADGVRTSDGVLHPADVVVYGTGFAATEFLAPMRVTGRDGQDLHEMWAGGAHAYLGITVPGFPNLFLLYGPNTNLGGGSIIAMLEAQAGYVVQAVRALSENGTGALEVREDVAEKFDVEMQERLAASVWTGCASWYREAGGRVSTNWPGLVTEYLDRTARFDVSDYRRVPVSANGPAQTSEGERSLVR